MPIIYCLITYINVNLHLSLAPSEQYVEKDSIPMKRKWSFTGHFYKDASPTDLIINYLLPCSMLRYYE